MKDSTVVFLQIKHEALHASIDFRVSLCVLPGPTRKVTDALIQTTIRQVGQQFLMSY
jgi:hypothetical protein